MRLYNFIILILLPLTLTGCYTSKQSYRFLQLWNSRRPVDQVLKDPQVLMAQKSKIRFIQNAQTFAHTHLFLNQNNDFDSVIMLPGPTLIHLLFVASPASLRLYDWYYPIIGSFKYQGFYDKPDAISKQVDWEKDGYETYLSTASSFSGLGWFNTPITSNILTYHHADLAGTIFHEMAHTTIFFKNHTRFNENYAVFVEQRGVDSFLSHLETEENPEFFITPQQRKRYQKSHITRSQLRTALKALRQRLKKEVYQQTPPNLVQRAVIFAEFKAQYQAQFPWYFKSPLNNARILSSSIYDPDLTSFDRLFAQTGNWKAFNRALERLPHCPAFALKGPFAALEELLQDSCSPAKKDAP